MIRARLSENGRFLVAPLCLAVAVLWFAVAVPEFATLGNLGNVLSQMWVLALLAVGQMFAIVTRGFDISVGSVAALSGTVAAMAANALGFWALPAGALEKIRRDTLGYVAGSRRFAAGLKQIG